VFWIILGLILPATGKFTVSQKAVFIMKIIELKHTEEKLRFLNFRDAQTGLYNRAYFCEEMERLESSRQFPISIIACGLEDLEQINNTLGDDTIERMIIATAHVLAANIFRKEDLVARIAENQFAILLTKVNGIDIFSIRSRLQRAITNYNKQDKDDDLLRPISLLCGFVTVHQGGSIFEEYRRINLLWNMR
jgi:diguanylate cyclase (GGDEF)-like protein